MVNLTPKQKRIVKAKIKGEKNIDIAKREYPTANPNSQAVLVSRELHKTHVAQYYEQGKIRALQANDITWNRVVKPISDALNATMLASIEGDYYDTGIPNHTTRLAASKRAQELLESVKEEDSSLNEGSKVSMDSLKDMDEVELSRAVFRKASST